MNSHITVMPINHYHESGSYNFISAALSFSILIVAALILGYAYSTISLFNPIIYLNILLVIGIGIAIYWLTSITFTLLKLHNQNLRILFVLVSSILVWYFQWCATIDYLITGNVDSPIEYLASLDWIFYTTSFIENFRIAYQYGYYEMFGMVIKGPVLIGIWLIELGIFIGYPLIMVLAYKPRPFSTRLNSWYPHYILEKQFRVVTRSPQFEQELADHPLEKITNLSAGRGNTFSNIHIYYEEQESSQYLSIVNVSYDKDKDKTNTDHVITNLEISSSQAKGILAGYSHNKT